MRAGLNRKIFYETISVFRNGTPSQKKVRKNLYFTGKAKPSANRVLSTITFFRNSMEALRKVRRQFESCTEKSLLIPSSFWIPKKRKKKRKKNSKWTCSLWFFSGNLRQGFQVLSEKNTNEEQKHRI